MKKEDYLKNIENCVQELKNFDSNKLDIDTSYLKEAFGVLEKNSIFDLHLVKQEELKFEVFSKLTGVSGALCFLLIQILAANKRVSSSSIARENILENRCCGVAINHLRADESLVSGKKEGNKFLIDGRLTWASGYKIFDSLLMGFHHDNKEYMAIVDFKAQNGFEIGNADSTLVAFGMNTVNIDLKSFEIDESMIVSIDEIGKFCKTKSISKTIHYAIYSIAKKALDEIKEDEVYDKFEKLLEKNKNDFLECNSELELDKLRVELFNLTQKMITLAMILKGGKSILTIYNLQRYYREIIMFNSNGLNTKMKKLFIEDLMQSV